MSTENNAEAPQTGLKKFEEKSFEAVNAKINSFIENGDIRIPQNYSAENAVRSAWLHLQDVKDRADRPVLEVCTAASISNSILKMVVQGLSVVKNQCAFIAYGNQLTYQRQYQGAIALAKRMADVKDVRANAIYEGDEFAFEVNTDNGIKKVIKHTQTLDGINPDKVKGAYAIVVMNDGSTEHVIMNMAQIRKSWEMGATKGSSPAHKNFADEMACKTVINRACKLKIQTSDDSDLYDDDSEKGIDAVGETVKNEVATKAHKRAVNFEEAEVIPEASNKKEVVKPTAVQQQPESNPVKEEEPGY